MMMIKWIIIFAAILAISAAPVVFAAGNKASLILQATGIFISSTIAIVAIWGEHIRAIFAGPKLILSLYNEEGELIEYPGSTAARCYYLKLTNKRPGTIARDTRVQISSIQRNKSGIWQSKQIAYGTFLSWGGMDYAARNIPYEAEARCGVLSIYQAGQCSITSDIHPVNFNTFLEAGDILRMEVITVAENAKSRPLTIEISWDGRWSNSDQEMKMHLRIKEI